MSDEYDYKTFRFIQGGFTSTPFLNYRDRNVAAEAALLQNPATPVILYESTEILTPKVQSRQLWQHYPKADYHIGAQLDPFPEHRDPAPDAIGVPDPETIVTR